MKLVIVGGGSSYTPELVEGVINNHDDLPITEVCLMDVDPGRLEVSAGMSARMFEAKQIPVSVTATTDQARALEGADFVNNLLRVGGQHARINDEQIPVRHGVVGQETTGPGGMMKALRTVPVVLGLADEMYRICPDAWLINYTNPSGIVAEALGNYSKVRHIGLCSGPANWIADILNLMGVENERATVDWIGLNHLGFAVRVVVDGRDATDSAIDAVADTWPIDGEWIRCLGAIPATYLRYYYHHGAQVAEASRPGFVTRGQRVLDIEQELLRQYANPGLVDKPPLLAERGGRGYSDIAIASMKAIYANTGSRQIVQVLNGGAVDGIPRNASVEIQCVVDQTGAHPIRFGEIPLPIRGLLQNVKAYESLTVRAAVEADRQIAMQALMAHPLVPGWDVAKPLFAELVDANAEFLPWAT